MANLSYGNNATIYRINRGWRAREQERIYSSWTRSEGYWASNSRVEDTPEDERNIVMSWSFFVEDRRNSLTFELPTMERTSG